MIDLPFDPDISLFGARLLSWHSFFSVVGMLTGVIVTIRLMRDRIPEDRGYVIASWAVATGFVGARLLHVAEKWDTYAADPGRIVAVWDGGSSILGAVIGGYIAIAVTAWRMGAPVGYALDTSAAMSGIGMGIGRIGDLINGEHHAVACSGLPWCVRYTDANTLGQRDYVHPATTYEMLVDFAAAALLLWLRPRFAGRSPEGRLLWAYVLIYSVARFLISFLRLDPLVFAGLREAQLVSVGLAVVASGALAYLVFARRRRLSARVS